MAAAHPEVGSSPGVRVPELSLVGSAAWTPPGWPLLRALSAEVRRPGHPARRPGARGRPPPTVRWCSGAGAGRSASSTRQGRQAGHPQTACRDLGLASAPRRTVAVDPVEDKTGAIVVIQQDRIADAMGGDVGDHQVHIRWVSAPATAGRTLGGYLGTGRSPGRLRLVKADANVMGVTWRQCGPRRVGGDTGSPPARRGKR